MAFANSELHPLIGKSGNTVWLYLNSAVDTLVTQRGAGYFAGAEARGMKVGDHIISSDTAGVGGVLRADSIAAGNVTAT